LVQFWIILPLWEINKSLEQVRCILFFLAEYIEVCFFIYILQTTGEGENPLLPATGFVICNVVLYLKEPLATGLTRSVILWMIHYGLWLAVLAFSSLILTIRFSEAMLVLGVQF